MRLTDILSPECVKVPLSATDKKSAIAELVELLATAGKVTDREQMLQAALERETTRTTGIGNGLAIPHGKCAAVRTLVMAVGKPAAPIDFDSIDGKPVNIVILLASPPDKTGPHIQALARVSRLMTEPKVRAALDKAPTAADVFATIAAYEGEK